MTVFSTKCIYAFSLMILVMFLMRTYHSCIIYCMFSKKEKKRKRNSSSLPFASTWDSPDVCWQGSAYPIFVVFVFCVVFFLQFVLILQLVPNVACFFCLSNIKICRVWYLNLYIPKLSLLSRICKLDAYLWRNLLETTQK